MATGATIKAVEGFDKTGLKQAETTEKNPLPDKEGELSSRRYRISFSTILTIYVGEVIINGFHFFLF